MPAAAQPATENFVALAPGTRIGRYEFLSVLGHGGFGITYSARDTTLGRDLAIKEYLPSSLALRTTDSVVIARSTQVAEDFVWGRERFLDEARTLASLEGAPGVVRVYDFLEANGTAYMVMALARGETLEQRLKRDSRLPAPIVERLLHQLLDGLEQVHKTGFLHRDIKPANIVLDASDNPTLIDFGASRFSIADRTSAMTAVFTPRYAAAEQLMSDKQGPWTDIYGVSVTLYHAITGQSPPGALERALKDNHEPLARLLPAGFSRQLLEGIDAGMAVRAADRPQSIAAWRALLEGMTALEGRPQRARPAALPKPVVPTLDDTVRPVAPSAPSIAPPAAPPIASAPSRRRTMLWVAVASMAILAAGTGAYFAFMPREAPTTLSERQRIEEQVRRAREQLAFAEQAAQRQADDESRQAREAEARRQAAVAAEKQRAEEEAARRLAIQTEQQRREREAARQKAEAEAEARRRAEIEEGRRKAEADAAERARALQEIQKAREALAAAEAARKEAEAEAERLKAEAASKAKVEAEAAKQRADAETAAKAKAAAEAAAKQTADAAAAAKAKVEAEVVAKQKADAEAVAAAKARAEAEATAKLRAEAEAAARQKADAEAAAAARARAEIDVTARQKATAEAATAAKAKAEAEAAVAKARAEAETAAKQKAEAEAAAARARAEAEAAGKQKVEAEAAAAKAKAEAEAVAKQKPDTAVAAAAPPQKTDDDQRKAAEAAEAVLRLSTIDRQRLQVALTALGFDTRGADGVLGPRSREMIAAWQRRQNLPSTGFLAASQQQSLLREAAPAIARYDEEQKKAEEARRKAEEESRARAAQQPPAASTAVAPPVAAAIAPPAAPAAPQSSGSRDGLWFGALDCKNSGRQSVQGNVVNGSGTLAGPYSTTSIIISGNTVTISVQGNAANASSGKMTGELRGRSVFARGTLSRFNSSEECTASLVGP